VAKQRSIGLSGQTATLVWDNLMHALAAFLEGETVPWVSREARVRRDPFRVLVSTIISLRTKDDVTEAASGRLFAMADTPETLAALDVDTIARAIMPANFYPTKARRIREISIRIRDEFGGKVPADLDVLLSFTGVGRKTANLVLTDGFDMPGICVDTHVHRILNRMGLVSTRNPDETEEVLRQVLPERHWKSINALLVAFGQTLCRPQSPWCSRCPVAAGCRRLGVDRTR
jgi:endonuclease-3